MKFFLMIFICVFVTGTKVISQEFLLRGKVISVKDSLPIEGAHIINTSNNSATISGVDGQFFLRASVLDSLFISNIGYYSYSFFLAAEFNIHLPVFVYLYEKEYELDTFMVHPFPSKGQFRQVFLNTKVENENKEIQLNMPEVKNMAPLRLDDYQANKKVNNANAPQMVGSGIPLSFGKKKYPDKNKKFANTGSDPAIQAIIEKKYNNEFITQLTGIYTEEEVIAFKKYCNFPNEFILQNEPYVIAEAIKSCFQQYHK